MRYLTLALILSTSPLAAQQRTATADSVVAVAKRLFDGMRLHDSTMIASAFAPGAQMTGVPRPGQPVSFQPVTAFIAQASRPGAAWDEQMYDPEVRVDADLATLHVFYTFALGDRPSHCGVDLMWLVRLSGEWKIAAIADTRRTVGCEVSGRVRVP